MNVFFFQFPDVELPLDTPSATIFRFVQMLISQNKCPKTDKLKRIWEPTYTCVARTLTANQVQPSLFADCCVLCSESFTRSEKTTQLPGTTDQR